MLEGEDGRGGRGLSCPRAPDSVYMYTMYKYIVSLILFPFRRSSLEQKYLFIHIEILEPF